MDLQLKIKTLEGKRSQTFCLGSFVVENEYLWNASLGFLLKINLVNRVLIWHIYLLRWNHEVEIDGFILVPISSKPFWESMMILKTEDVDGD